MTEPLVHRGPDHGATWIDRNRGVALGHRRLSIIDLSSAGNQPMHSKSGRFVTVFNGEIYNFLELRAELEKEGVGFGGSSDTEVLLAAVELWGIQKALERFDGMFAFALLDRKENVLYLVRDRMGEKPLYYGWTRDAFVFASELKGLMGCPSFERRVSRAALALFVRYSYIPAPFSIFEKTYKLPAGSILELPLTQVFYSDEQAPRQYWSLARVAERGQQDPFQGDEHEARCELESRLARAVRGQMISDVPLGAFLSGGVDSSTVVALMQSYSRTSVRTFSIGFREAQYDEAHFAKRIANHLGTQHTELYVDSEQALEVVPLLPRLYDEPFADVSQIPTFILARLARATVKVSLSGDGGDELFAGYNRYRWARQAWALLQAVPTPLRGLLRTLLLSQSAGRWEEIIGVVRRFSPRVFAFQDVGEKIHKLASLMALRHFADLYTTAVSHWEEPGLIVSQVEGSSTALQDRFPGPDEMSRTESMMLFDSVTYLPDDILVKVDRAAMGVSLETRIPLLDRHVVEFLWSLPMSLKVRRGTSKWLLREILYQRVPRTLVDRPKMGFSPPLGEWLRRELRPWAEELLSEHALRAGGYFNPAPIRQRWSEHLSGKRSWHCHLWNILSFQAWMREYKPI